MSRTWLARLSYSFFILAAVLLWELYNIHQGRRGNVPEWRVILYLLGAGLGVVMGALGIRERHRARDDGEQQDRES
jgi:hypothetical protein